LAVLRLLRTTAGDRSRGGWSATAPASIPPAAGSALPDRRRPLVMGRLYEKSAPVGWGTAIYGGSPSKRATKFWALLCPASLRYARSRQAGPQKRDHERAGRKSASHASQWRVSTAGSGASALRPFAGGLSTSSSSGDETHFCPVPLPRKTPSGGSLYRTRRNLRSPSLKVDVAAAWNERYVMVPSSPR
jgi:hypothetical protein